MSDTCLLTFFQAEIKCRQMFFSMFLLGTFDQKWFRDPVTIPGDLSVLVAVANVPRGRVGEVAPGPAAVEDLVLELGLRIPQSPDLFMKLGQLRVQRPLLRSELNLKR